MKHLFSTFLILITFAVYGQNTPYFATNPTLSPDGQMAYFSFESDIWKVPVSGGEAVRVTALEGNEINPRISPDGKWLAFSSNQYGNYDVFVMPLTGGDIRQLTYHQANDRVENWGWDSQTIYFTSMRYNNFGSYSVDVAGGTAKRLFNHFFNTSNGLAETPAGEYIFTATMESESQSTRKRYKGENNPDLLGYHPKTGKYTQHTTYEGKDFNPTVDKNGIIYFISDENNGEYNLYSLNKGVKTALTNFPTSIRRPSVSANGERVIFEKDYQLHIYEVASGQTKLLNYGLGLNKSLDKTKDFTVSGKITSFDVSPDNKKIAFVSRGELFVSDIKGEFVRQIDHGNERAMEVKWLKDNKTLLFNKTKAGYQNLYTIHADGSGGLKELTNDVRNNRDISLNNDLSHAVYLSGRDQVRILDLNSFESKTIVNDEIWGFQNSSPSFSPNGEYVLYTAVRNFEQDIFVYHIEDGKSINLTKTGVSETNPVWSEDGRYIYFTSNRTAPSYPLGMRNATVYSLALDWYTKPFKTDKFDELFVDKKEDKPDSTFKAITINTDGLLERVTAVSSGFGSQNNPRTFSDKGKTYVFYNSNIEKGKMTFYRTTIEDFKANKTEKVAERTYSDLIKVKNNYYALIGGDIHTYNLSSNKTTKLNINFTFERDLQSEFNQMFYEAWAGLEENYYNGDFNGVDWEAVRDQYAAFLPSVNSRNNLRVLINDMLGELNSSHLGFTSMGGEEAIRSRYVTNETGIIFDNDHPYTVDYIVRKSNANTDKVDVRKGDVLTKVNGVSVDKNVDRDFYFMAPSMREEISLEFERKGESYTVNIHPQTYTVLKNQLYDEWILDNKNKVNQWSPEHKIAYSHMKNMSTGELESFMLDMMEQENISDALIFDLRYNRGGNVHDDVLQFLARRPYLQWQYRGGKKAPQGNFAPAGKPIVLLINEASLSDAEMTAAGFKELKLGTIIGTETYRWIIFTSAKRLVDGSSYRVPGWGCFTLDGVDLEDTGVAPDIYVKNTFEDRIKGNDPQLERAVQEILKQLK